MAPEQEANVRLKHAARVFAFFNPTADARRIEQGLELIWPFALALIMELGTILFLGFGLAHDQGRHEVAGSVEASTPFDPSASMKSRRGRKSGCSEFHRAVPETAWPDSDRLTNPD